MSSQALAIGQALGDGPELGPLPLVEEAEGGFRVGDRGVVTVLAVPLAVEVPGLPLQGDPQPGRGGEVAKRRDALVEDGRAGEPALLRTVIRRSLGRGGLEVVEELQGEGGALRHHDAVAAEHLAQKDVAHWRPARRPLARGSRVGGPRVRQEGRGLARPPFRPHPAPERRRADAETPGDRGSGPRLRPIGRCDARPVDDSPCHIASSNNGERGTARSHRRPETGGHEPPFASVMPWAGSGDTSPRRGAVEQPRPSGGRPQTRIT